MIALAISNKIKVVSDTTNTGVVKYRADRTMFGFDWDNAPVDFYVQQRLGIDLQNLSFKETKQQYRTTNGYYRNGTVLIDKQKELNTDWFDNETTEALLLAMRHDFYVDDVNYFQDGEYELENNEYDELQRGTATLIQQGYNKTNLKC